MSSDLYSIGEVATFAGVSVRTLHHYDEIGLLRATARTGSGYRRYGDADLQRLQRILGYRELGFSLAQIAAVLDDAAADPIDHLRRQHVLLTERVARLRAQLSAIEKTMEAHQMGIRLNPEEMFEVFGDVDPNEHAAEAEQRWGDTDAYRQSAQRTASYGKPDWQRMKKESTEVEQQLLRSMATAVAPDSTAATAAAEAHRALISRWFYDCDHAMHRRLADMYVADARFAAHYDKLREGLARYVHDAIHANADAAEAG